jgi:outer membrane protein assembly factor BamE (lipoprotein component of BamABCDE complex)
MFKNNSFIMLSGIFLLVVFQLLCGCVPQMTAAEHQQSLGSTQEREMTVGVVQKEIRVGMSQADVAVALGSPNIVTRDSVGDETWIYDKIATEASYSYSGQSESVAGGVGAGGLLDKVLILGGIGFGRSGTYGAGARATTQKTLTVVIKFDRNSMVKDFSYHASKF